MTQQYPTNEQHLQQNFINSLYFEKEPILNFLVDTPLHTSQKSPLLSNIYNEYLSGIKFTSEQRIYTYLQKMRSNSDSLFSFISQILDLLANLSEIKKDPFMTSILKSSQLIIENENREDQSSVSFNNNEKEKFKGFVSVNNETHNNSSILNGPEGEGEVEDYGSENRGENTSKGRGGNLSVKSARKVKKKSNVKRIHVKKQKKEKEKEKRDWWGEDSKTVTTFDSEDLVTELINVPKEKEEIREKETDEKEEEDNLDNTVEMSEKEKAIKREESLGESINEGDDNNGAIWLEDTSENEQSKSLTPNKVIGNEEKNEDLKKKKKPKKNQRNLSIVNEEDSSEDEFDDSELTSKINFDELCRSINNVPLLTIQDDFLKISDLRKEYIVHYIDNTEKKDFEFSIKYLNSQEFASIDVEICESIPAYIQFCTKRRGFVFNCHRLKEDKDSDKFRDFLFDFMKNKEILKIGFDVDRYLRPLKKLFNSSIVFNNVLSFDTELFITNIPKDEGMNLSGISQRVLGNVLFLKLN